VHPPCRTALHNIQVGRLNVELTMVLPGRRARDGPLITARRPAVLAPLPAAAALSRSCRTGLMRARLRTTCALPATPWMPLVAARAWRLAWALQPWPSCDLQGRLTLVMPRAGPRRPHEVEPAQCRRFRCCFGLIAVGWDACIHLSNAPYFGVTWFRPRSCAWSMSQVREFLAVGAGHTLRPLIETFQLISH
jgi:hypothetical protein